MSDESARYISIKYFQPFKDFPALAQKRGLELRPGFLVTFSTNCKIMQLNRVIPQKSRAALYLQSSSLVTTPASMAQRFGYFEFGAY
ncbi:MAG: hypothetical protein ABIQ56_05430 [Chitinophagaceae bacterium]